MLKSLGKRMKKDLPRLADPTMVKKEVHKLAHMLSSIKGAVVEGIKKIRINKQKNNLKELNAIFWGELGMDARRFLETVRDLDQEELKFKQEKMKAAAGSGKNVTAADAAKNINMPAMKLTGVLGTTGAKNLDADSGLASGSYMSKGMKHDNVGSSATAAPVQVGGQRLAST